jgi:hypothetical protein
MKPRFVIFLIGLFHLILFSHAQDFELLDTVVVVEDLELRSFDYLNLYYRVPLRIKNLSSQQILIEGYDSDTEEGNDERQYRIEPEQTRQIYCYIPVDLSRGAINRPFYLLTEAQGNKNFRLRSKGPVPVVDKYIKGWSRIRETYAYPFKFEVKNTHDQPLSLDSLVYREEWIDPAYRFQEWDLVQELPLTIEPGRSTYLKVRIPTRGLYATIGARFHLHYHWGETDSGRFVPIGHAFGVEPNVWLQQGGEWNVGRIQHGSIINRSMWITNQSSLCLSLTSEDPNIIWCSADSLCPGDQAQVFVRYPTYCDTLGELDAEVALFINEFKGHVPIKLKGELYSDQELPEGFLVPVDSVFDPGNISLKSQPTKRNLQFYNPSRQAVLIQDVGTSQANAMRLAPGDTLALPYEHALGAHSQNGQEGNITVRYTVEGCPQDMRTTRVAVGSR